MKVVQAVTFAVALATLCLLQALQTEARDIVGRDTWCPCDPQGPPYQLLRGSDQVHKCEVGFYCDCAHQKRLQCFAPPFIKWKYDEDNQVCALRFDCAAFFRRVTTTTVPPTSPTKPPTTAPPTTEPSTAAPTTAAPTTTEPPTTEPSTTEPTTTKPTTTEPPTTEPPTTKVPTTAEPSTTPSTPEPTTAPTTTVTDASTTTVAPTTMPTTLRPRAHCTCNPNGPAYQLIRGDDELQKCYDGYYCDCRNREVYGCLDIWGIGWRFDEKTQRCEFEFDCQGYLRPTTTAAPTTEPSTTVPPTTEPSTTAAPTTEPSTTAPPTTEPSTTVPPTTEPSTTAPPTTEPSTTAPPTTEPSTTVPSTRPTEAPTTAEPSTTEPSTTEATSTAKPGPLAECTCDRWWDRDYELVRGEDQASSCTHGYYCDCSQYKRLRCFNVLTLGWRFDEDSQKCRFFNSCSALSN